MTETTKVLTYLAFFSKTIHMYSVCPMTPVSRHNAHASAPT